MKFLILFFKKNIFFNKIFNKIISFIIFIYLKFVLYTSKFSFLKVDNDDNIIKKSDNIVDILGDAKKLKTEKIIYSFWHNKIAYIVNIFNQYQGLLNIKSLASPHKDGMIISNIINFMGFEVISGSTNRNTSFAVKEIIKSLMQNHHIIITPDGPRGPKYQINSVIDKICNKYADKLILLSGFSVKSIMLNSWDKMHIVMPFSNIEIKIKEINIKEVNIKEVNIDNNYLQEQLMSMTYDK